MTLMTPISVTPPATAIRHPALDRAERLAACKAVVVEMLAEAARTLDLAATMPPSDRSGLQHQSRMRMNGAVLLLDSLDRNGEDFVAILTEIENITARADSQAVRNIAVRLQAAFDIELYQITIGIAYDRYA